MLIELGSTDGLGCDRIGKKIFMSEWDWFFYRHGKRLGWIFCQDQKKSGIFDENTAENKTEFFSSDLSSSKTCSDFDELPKSSKKSTYGIRNVIEHNTPITNVIEILYQFKINWLDSKGRNNRKNCFLIQASCVAIIIRKKKKPKRKFNFQMHQNKNPIKIQRLVQSLVETVKNCIMRIANNSKKIEFVDVSVFY